MNTFRSTQGSESKGQPFKCHFYSFGSCGYSKFHNYMILHTKKRVILDTFW